MISFPKKMIFIGIASIGLSFSNHVLSNINPNKEEKIQNMLQKAKKLSARGIKLQQNSQPNLNALPVVPGNPLQGIKSQQNPQPNPEPQPTPENQPQQNPQPNPEPQPTPENQPQQNPQPNPEPQPTPENEPQQNPQPNPEPQPTPENEPQQNPQPNPEPQPTPENQPQQNPQPNMETPSAQENEPQRLPQGMEESLPSSPQPLEETPPPPLPTENPNEMPFSSQSNPPPIRQPQNIFKKTEKVEIFDYSPKVIIFYKPCDNQPSPCRRPLMTNRKNVMFKYDKNRNINISGIANKDKPESEINFSDNPQIKHLN